MLIFIWILFNTLTPFYHSSGFCSFKHHPFVNNKPILSKDNPLQRPPKSLVSWAAHGSTHESNFEAQNSVHAINLLIEGVSSSTFYLDIQYLCYVLIHFDCLKTSQTNENNSVSPIPSTLLSLRSNTLLLSYSHLSYCFPLSVHTFFFWISSQCSG